jgi:hypothetical protein
MIRSTLTTAGAALIAALALACPAAADSHRSPVASAKVVGGSGYTAAPSSSGVAPAAAPAAPAAPSAPAANPVTLCHWVGRPGAPYVTLTVDARAARRYAQNPRDIVPAPPGGCPASAPPAPKPAPPKPAPPKPVPQPAVAPKAPAAPNPTPRSRVLNASAPKAVTPHHVTHRTRAKARPRPTTHATPNPLPSVLPATTTPGPTQTISATNTGSGRQLPYTGVNAGLIALIGLMLLSVGVALRFAVRSEPAAAMPRGGPRGAGRAPRLALPAIALLATFTALAPRAHAAAARSPLVPSPTSGRAWLASILRITPAYRAPWDRHVLQSINPVARAAGGRSQLLVLESALVKDPLHGTGTRLWLRVQLPQRPNGAAGWIRADDVSVHSTPWRVVISTGRRTVTVLRDGRRVQRFRAVVGKPSTPTPLGLFAINEIVRQADPHGFLGPWAIHLTAHSNVLFNYGGGPGRVAIHGRDGPSLHDPLGSARSHGCIRVPDRWISYLANHVEPGVPVRIER